MKLLVRQLFCLFLGISGLLCCCPASAQFSKLDELTAQAAKRLKAQKPHLIGIAEFTSADGSPSNQGDYFAWFVSTSLVHHVKQLPVADREIFKALLVKDGITPKDLDSIDTLKRLTASRISILSSLEPWRSGPPITRSTSPPGGCRRLRS